MKYAALLFLFLACGPCHAEDPFACVDEDVVDAFLWNDTQRMPEYSTEVPREFVNFVVPAQFSLIGSERGWWETRVVYKTRAGMDLAADSALAALAGEGWTEKRGQMLGGIGFHPAGRPTRASLCHPGLTGTLNVRAAERDGTTFVTYALSAMDRSCDSESDESFFQRQMGLVPKMRLPEDVEVGQTGTGSSSMGARTEVSGAGSRDELQANLEEQIRLQGWTHQANWSSEVSSGSVWSLESEDMGLVIGTLHLVDDGNNPIRITFGLEPAVKRRR